MNTEGKQEEQDLALDLNLPFNIQVNFNMRNFFDIEVRILYTQNVYIL